MGNEKSIWVDDEMREKNEHPFTSTEMNVSAERRAIRGAELSRPQRHGGGRVFWGVIPLGVIPLRMELGLFRCGGISQKT